MPIVPLRLHTLPPLLTSQSTINTIMQSLLAPIPFFRALTDHLTRPVSGQSYPLLPAYFQITSPSHGTQLQNGAANKVTWVKGLLDDGLNTNARKNKETVERDLKVRSNFNSLWAIIITLTGLIQLFFLERTRESPKRSSLLCLQRSWKTSPVWRSLQCRRWIIAIC